jgi:hypothetical protein
MRRALGLNLSDLAKLVSLSTLKKNGRFLCGKHSGLIYTTLHRHKNVGVFIMLQVLLINTNLTLYTFLRPSQLKKPSAETTAVGLWVMAKVF